MHLPSLLLNTTEKFDMDNYVHVIIKVRSNTQMLAELSGLPPLIAIMVFRVVPLLITSCDLVSPLKIGPGPNIYQ